MLNACHFGPGCHELRSEPFMNSSLYPCFRSDLASYSHLLRVMIRQPRSDNSRDHSRWGASWNWRWRLVGDDEERRSPSPEPQTDSRSALPRKNRAWRRLCLVDRDNSFSLIFSPKIGIYSVRVEVCGATRWVQRALVGCAHPGPLSGGC